jgi:hypothetical protein
MRRAIGTSTTLASITSRTCARGAPRAHVPVGQAREVQSTVEYPRGHWAPPFAGTIATGARAHVNGQAVSIGSGIIGLRLVSIVN